MGEYWKPVNVTRKEYVHAHRVNEGLKLAEWTWPGSAVMTIVATWAPTDDIRVVSDYGGDIRVTDAARASREKVSYDSVEDSDYTGVESLTGCDIVHGATIGLLVEAVGKGIPYDDWHREWRVELGGEDAKL